MSTVSTVTSTTAPAGGGPSEHDRLKRYRTVAVALAAALALVAALAAWLAVAKQSVEDDLERASADQATYEAAVDAEAAARELLLDMTSYDYRDLEADFAWLDAIADEELRSRMEETSGRLQKVIRQSHAIAEGEVVDSAYRAVDENQAVVLAFVRQEIRDTRNRGFRLEEQWVTMTMVRDGDAWAIEKIDLTTVPPPGG